MSWALYEAPAGDPTGRLVLVHLAEHADPKGRGAFPSARTIAGDIEVSVRTIRRQLDDLEERDLIRRGDQQLVSHISADKRPVVWDLNMDLKRERGAKLTRRDVTPTAPRGRKRRDTDVTPPGDTDDMPPMVSGVTPVTERGDTGVHSEVTPTTPKPSTEPSMTPTESNLVTRAEARETTPADPDEIGGALPGMPSVAAVPPPPERPKRRIRIPKDFALTPDLRAFATDRGVPDGDVGAMFEHFRNHHTAKGSTMIDWDAAWRTWVLGSPQYDRGRYSTGRKPTGRLSVAERNTDILDRARARLNGIDQPDRQMGIFPIVIDGETA